MCFSATANFRMMGFLILGSGLALYILWGLMMDPLQVYAVGHSIVYNNALTTTTIVAVLYVIATCGALFFSGFRDLVLLGWLNLVGLIVVMLIKSYAFTSVWCAYAAVVSVVIYFFFRRSSHERPARYLLTAEWNLSIETWNFQSHDHATGFHGQHESASSTRVLAWNRYCGAGPSTT